MYHEQFFSPRFLFLFLFVLAWLEYLVNILYIVGEIILVSTECHGHGILIIHYLFFFLLRFSCVCTLWIWLDFFFRI